MRRTDLFMDKTGSGLVSTQTLVSYNGIDTNFNRLNPVSLRDFPTSVLKLCYQKFKGGATEKTRLMLCCPYVKSLQTMKINPLDLFSGEK